jgi:RNA polymerase sigma-70 factor (ECF subfamily)
MRRALLGLRKRDRALLALRFEQDLSFPEIGRIFGRPEATVKTWVHRALDKLQNEMRGAQPSPAVEES